MHCKMIYLSDYKMFFSKLYTKMVEIVSRSKLDFRIIEISKALEKLLHYVKEVFYHSYLAEPKMSFIDFCPKLALSCRLLHKIC